MYSPSGARVIIIRDRDLHTGSFGKVLNRINQLQFMRSFRVRIFFVLLIIGIIPSILVRDAILYNYENRAVNVRESEVSNQLNIIANHLITYNYLSDQSNSAVNAELEQISNLYDGRILIIGGNFKAIKDTNGVSTGRTIISEEVIKCFKGVKTVNYDSTNGFIELTIPINDTIAEGAEGSEESVVRGVMLASVSTDTIAMTLKLLSRLGWIIAIGMIALIFLMAMFFSRLLTDPFNKVTEAINDVKEGFSDEPLSVPDYKETEHIVDAFNRVLKRMKVIDESRQEFVSNVSHELKTPITSMKLLAESLMAQEDVPSELYREFMEDIAGEIDREDKIITDLLELVKLDKTNAGLNIESVDINGMIELILKRMKPIAAVNNVELVFDSVRSITAHADDVKLTLALTNLIENGIKYNKDGGSVYITLDGDHQSYVITVRDTGIGIPEESIDQIFERFYRVDKSHSREIGGTGLGLSIARNIILMHRGTVTVESVIDEGTTFTVRLPL